MRSLRNGTPRQSFVVSEARSRFVLERFVPEAAISELKGFSHLWIIYVFHMNTNLHQCGKKFKAKVSVPRLNGQKVGVYGTRSPHRYNPIGLSIAKILKVFCFLLSFRLF